MSSAYELLTQAQERIRQNKQWTQDAMARNAAGTPVQSKSPAAVQWSAIGALAAEAQKRDDGEILISTCMGFLTRAAVELGFGNMSHLSAATGHNTVMQAYDLARNKAKADNTVLPGTNEPLLPETG